MMSPSGLTVRCSSSNQSAQVSVMWVNTEIA